MNILVRTGFMWQEVSQDALWKKKKKSCTLACDSVTLSFVCILPCSPFFFFFYKRNKHTCVLTQWSLVVFHISRTIYCIFCLQYLQNSVVLTSILHICSVRSSLTWGAWVCPALCTVISFKPVCVMFNGSIQGVSGFLLTNYTYRSRDKLYVSLAFSFIKQCITSSLHYS